MNITQISVDKFNELAQSEPCASIYQSSYWSDLMIKKGYEPLFIQYTDDNNICVALGMFLLKRDTFISFKPTAHCPYGYLINYYDKDILKQFSEDLKEFFKEKKVSKIVIEPNVAFHNGKYTNEAVVKALLESGYTKSNNLLIYSLDTENHEEKINAHNFILKAKEVEEDVLFALTKNSDYLELYETVKPFVTLYAVRPDSTKTRRKLNDSIKECEKFISEHEDDYKFDEKNSLKMDMIRDRRQSIVALDRFEDKHGVEGVLTLACVCKYAGKYNILFTINNDTDNFFEAENALVDKLVKDAIKQGCHEIYSLKPFAYAEKVELLGEYTYKF